MKTLVFTLESKYFTPRAAWLDLMERHLYHYTAEGEKTAYFK